MNKIGKFSLVHPKAIIGQNVIIGNFCIIPANVVIGDNTIIKNNVEMRTSDSGHGIHIGAGCLIETGVLLDGACDIESTVTIGPFCEIKNNVNCKKNSYLQGCNRIAANCVIGEESLIKYGAILTSNVFIGKNCFIGPHVIFTGDDASRNAIKAEEPHTSRVDNGAFIGANSCMMPGTSIGKNALVGACSFVREDIGNDSLWYGIPARFIKKR